MGFNFLWPSAQHQLKERKGPSVSINLNLENVFMAPGLRMPLTTLGQ